MHARLLTRTHAYSLTVKGKQTEFDWVYLRVISEIMRSALCVFGNAFVFGNNVLQQRLIYFKVVSSLLKVMPKTCFRSTASGVYSGSISTML